VTVTNTQAYYNTEIIKAVDSFFEKALGCVFPVLKFHFVISGQHYKTFFAVINPTSGVFPYDFD
jgi:hypothetical protein